MFHGRSKGMDNAKEDILRFFLIMEKGLQPLLKERPSTLHAKQELGDSDLTDLAAVHAYRKGGRVYCREVGRNPGRRGLHRNFQILKKPPDSARDAEERFVSRWAE
jgi:hypothetical protein